MPGPYNPTGPFNNNAAPGLSNTFFNNLEAYIAWAEGDASAQVTVTGTTAGSATCYQFIQGAFKAFFLYYNGYRNSTATEQLLALPVGFTAYCLWFAGAIPQTHLFTGSTQVLNSVKVVTTISNGGSAGGVTQESLFQGYAMGDSGAAFDHIGLGTSQGQTFTAGLLAFGI